MTKTSGTLEAMMFESRTIGRGASGKGPKLGWIAGRVRVLPETSR